MESSDSIPTVPKGASDKVLVSMGIVGAILLLFAAQAPTDILAQLIIAGVLLSLLVVLRALETLLKNPKAPLSINVS